MIALALVWLVVPLVLFSLSRPKRPHYVLPLMPATAAVPPDGPPPPAR